MPWPLSWTAASCGIGWPSKPDWVASVLSAASRCWTRSSAPVVAARWMLRSTGTRSGSTVAGRRPGRRWRNWFLRRRRSDHQSAPARITPGPVIPSSIHTGRTSTFSSSASAVSVDGAGTSEGARTEAVGVPEDGLGVGNGAAVGVAVGGVGRASGSSTGSGSVWTAGATARVGMCRVQPMSIWLGSVRRRPSGWTILREASAILGQAWALPSSSRAISDRVSPLRTVYLL